MTCSKKIENVAEKNKLRGAVSSWVESFTVLKFSFRFGVRSLQISLVFNINSIHWQKRFLLMEMDKLSLKFALKCKEPKIAKQILNRTVIIANFKNVKNYCNIAVIKLQIEQWKNIEPRNIIVHTISFDLW